MLIPREAPALGLEMAPAAETQRLAHTRGSVSPGTLLRVVDTD